jgi:acetyl-CoA carboxylase carboxyltransferase component
LRAEIEARLARARNPFKTAEAFMIEEIIDPRDTRPLLTDWVPLAYANEATRLQPKARGMRP